MLKMRSIYSKPMFTHIRLATCDCDIFAAITFSYSVHTLATCDMRPRRATATCDRDKFAHVAILSHVA